MDLPEEMTGEEICITGMAGTFPESDNVYQFRDNLFNKVNMITDDDRRWKRKKHDVPSSTGKINNIDKFDASFFSVHHKQAQVMDPVCRILLEKAYEAVIDAGVNPHMLRNTATGVFMGSSMSETQHFWLFHREYSETFAITGCALSMYANRISYWLGCTGPSYTVDSACSSSLTALDIAFHAIKSGNCTAAIVGGSNLCLFPQLSRQFARLGVLCSDGQVKSFDESADGYVRSEAIGVIFLQKAKDARRIYAKIVHTKSSNDGFKPQGITYPSSDGQRLLFNNFYEEMNINPHDVEYIEAHGTGTKVGDPREMDTVDKVFCTNRKTQLKIGSIKSNMGHAEAGSGICSVIKMCIAYECGYLPPNLHFKTPKKEIEGIVAGRIKVITEKTPWGKNLSGINGFGFGGSNTHVLLDKFNKYKINGGAPVDDLPRLICSSGRTESAVNRILNDVELRPIDAEFVKLLHSIHEYEIRGHAFRGYTLLRTNGNNIGAWRDVQHSSGMKRPVWFLFSGMGSQWAGCGTQLLKLPVFRCTIDKCQKALEPMGVDLIKIITDPDPKIFDNILHSFIAITSIQVGLCDVLKTIDVQPDFIIGHSMGEIACAYVDGCLTVEQAVLASYFRGLSSIQTPLIFGAMAATGLGYEQIKDILPKDIEVGCHNAADSCTISGPAESVRKFVIDLKNQGIFAKEVQVSNIAYHSKYIKDAGAILCKYLKSIIPKPELRSSKWISTSVPKHLENQEEALYCSAEYQTNNLLNPVYFEEATKTIPPNAVIIEISPQGLLGAIMKRSHKDCINIPLTNKKHEDNLEHLFISFGKLFLAGLNPKLDNLYPEVRFPVSVGTPMLSHLVEWEHSESWNVPSMEVDENEMSGERTVKLNVNEEKWSFLNGHLVDGVNLFPATGYLYLVWETLAFMKDKYCENTSVVFENIRFIKATPIPKKGDMEFFIAIQKGNKKFEIMENNTTIVTGSVYYEDNITYRQLPPPKQIHNPDSQKLLTKDIYRELKLRGYNYKDMFCGIEWTNVEGTRGTVKWEENWITYLDTVLQFKVFSIDTRNLFVPTRIEKLSINVRKHYESINKNETENCLDVSAYHELDLIRSGGTEVRGLYANGISKRRSAHTPLLEKYEFVPYATENEMSLTDLIYINIQIILENMPTLKFKSMEMLASDSVPLSSIILDVLNNIPLVQTQLYVMTNKNIDLGPNITIKTGQSFEEKKLDLFIGSDLLTDNDMFAKALSSLKEEAFVISRENLSTTVKDNYENTNVISAMVTEHEKLIMLRKHSNKQQPIEFVHVKQSDEDYNWINEIKKTPDEIKRIALVAQNEEFNGILGLVKCLRKEPGGEKFCCFSMIDSSAPAFSTDLIFYQKQLQKDVAINVFKDGKWGAYRHLQINKLDEFPAEHAYLNIFQRGNLSTLCWMEGPLRIAGNANLIHIYYSALNFRDIVTATGRISVDTVVRKRIDEECVQGLEYCGRLPNGDRVMGMVVAKGIANIVQPDEFLLWPIPRHWSLEDAVTIPVAYATAYYSLVMVGDLKPGYTVLIHSGTGGVGQAAINVCLFYGCKIFTTVGTEKKRNCLKRMFPQIPDECIGCSRDTSFEEMVKLGTNGKGVDIVLNSLSEDKLQASIRCLGLAGKFIEIGKYDIANNSSIGMQTFFKETSIHGIMMDVLFEMRPLARKYLSQLLLDGIKNGCVKPLSRIIYNIQETEKAFRLMASSKHVGKVIIKIRNEESNEIAKPEKLLLPAVPRYIGHEEASYVIIGGLGGFGLELADWLILQGVKKLILNSTRGVTNGYQAFRIKTWKNMDVDVIVNTDDVSTRKGCRQLLKSANELGPVRAIFNLAVILHDKIFMNQTPETFKKAFKPKAMVTKYLDEESKLFCPQLNDFVVFSSMSCGRGNAGQTNYGMANATMERICEERRKHGFPGLAIQWGAVGDVGLVADMFDRNAEIAGTLQQRIFSCLEVLDRFLKRNENPVMASMMVAPKQNMTINTTSLVDSIASIMNLKNLTTVPQELTLAELGMDSIMSVEIKQLLEREFELFLTLQEIRELTFARLAKYTVDDNYKDIGLKFILTTIKDKESILDPAVNMITACETSGNEILNDITKECHIFLIPGIEGIASIFEPICRQLKCSATVLQLHNYGENVQKIANHLMNIIKTYLKSRKNYALLGYSFGTLIALEIMKLLEAEGYMGTLFCIDGSPEYLNYIVNSNFEDTKDNTLQNTLFNLALDLVWKRHENKKKCDFVLQDNFEDKIKMFFENLPLGLTTSKEYLETLLTGVYTRIKAVVDYKNMNPTKLKSPIILIRTRNPINRISINECYGLQLYAYHPITIHKIDGDHLSILNSQVCAEIINNKIKTINN